MATFPAEDPIVVIKLGALGDIVRTSYVVSALARSTATPIIWITRKSGVDLIRFNSSIQRVLAIEEDALPERASHVLSLDDEMEAVTIARGIKSPRLTGAYLDDSGRITYTENSRVWFDMGLVSRFGKSAADELKRTNQRSHAEIFSEMLNVSDVTPSLFGDPLEQAHWQEQRAGASAVLGFNFFAGARWPSKEIPEHEALALLTRVDAHLSATQPSHKCVLLVDKSNLGRGRQLRERSATPVELWDTSRSVLSFAAAIAACDYVISADSLGLHLAIAQGVPNLSFYAPTSAAEIDTFGSGIKVCSEAADYCSYRPDSDNSSLTAERLFAAWHVHLGLGALNVRR